MSRNQALYTRSLASSLREALSDTPVVCLAGPRQCGKTTLARVLKPERAFVSLDHPPFLDAASADPAGFIGSLPRDVTIDEVQRAPGLLPAIKLAVDTDRRPGRFLLTGSADLLLVPSVTESLAGRMEVVRLMPLSESEKERRPGGFLRDFLEGRLQPSLRPGTGPTAPELATRLTAGGYPEPLTRTPARARQWHRQYMRGIVDRDVLDVSNVRAADQVGRLLEILAVRNGELFNASRVARDLGLQRVTVLEYVSVLERLFLVRRLLPWHRNPGKRLIKSPKTHLIDSGLAATLAQLSTGDWLTKRQRMGHLLESFVVQQFVAQAGWTDPDLRFWHYRDKDRCEVDLVITLGSRTWGVEVKATSTPGQSAGKGLRRLATLCGDDFEAGIVLYNGGDILPLAADRMLAVPFSELWTR